MNLTGEEVRVLQLLSKRIGLSEFKACAENDDQAKAMRDVFDKVAQSAIQHSCNQERGEDCNANIL
ncbi:MAG: DUF7706 family protein [Arenicella sp.]